MDTQRIKEITGFAPGDHCGIFVLRNSPQYNGQTGIIGRFFEDSGRFEVKLGEPFNKSVKIKVRNLMNYHRLNIERLIEAHQLNIVQPGSSLMRFLEQLTAHQSELDTARVQENTGDQMKAYRNICTLLEENFQEFEELKSEYYWNTKHVLLKMEIDSNINRIEHDKKKKKAFEIMNNATCPILQINALFLWCDCIGSNKESSMEECEEAIKMLQERIDTHYGYLHNIIRRLIFLIIKKDGDFEQAFSLFEEYIPICESLPIHYDQFMLRLDYAEAFTKWLSSLNGEINDDMITKGVQIINEMNDAWLRLIHASHNKHLDASKLHVEGRLILLRAQLHDHPDASMVENALRFFQDAAKIRLSTKGVYNMTHIYKGIAICCMHLGDAKNAQKFWRKAARYKDFKGWSYYDNVNEDLTEKIKKMQHTRDVSISLGKEVRCHRPECDNVGGAKNCTRCQAVKYCSRKCQTAHWKKHKKYCNKNPSPFK